MKDRDELLIRRALGRRPPPRPGPTLAEDVLRSVAAARRPAAFGGRGARRALAVAFWLLTGAACITVLASLEWSGASRVVAWGFALALVPLAYSATLWPGRFLGLLALCGGPVVPRPGDERPVDSRLHVRERG